MKILAVTGKLAESEVRRYVDNVHVVNIDVAAFITPSHLKSIDMSRYDLVLVPGLAKGDWRKLEEERGVKIRLGPIHASDLGIVLENLDTIELSHNIPACKLLNISKKEESVRLVDSQHDYVFKIGEVEIGGNTRIKIVAEVVDATEMERDELISKIDYFIESGADIIDLGIPVEFSVDDVRRAVKTAVEYSSVPVSIDTFSRKAIEAGINAGVDMVMSVSVSNTDAIEAIKDVAVVVVERNLEILSSLIEKVRRRTDKVIADCLLDAPFLISDSIIRYKNFRKRDELTPLLFGIGNVTELCDVDSAGMNALLTFIGEEIGVNLIFTTEASPKTRGCIKELKNAVYMAKAAKLKNTPPKDLGIDLLILKEKKMLETCKPDSYIKAEEGDFVRDSKGDFRIWNHGGKIVCSHEKLVVTGSNAKSISDTVIRKNLVSRLDHAAYLGRELQKAEIALKLGKNYVQDEELNFGIYSN